MATTVQNARITTRKPISPDFSSKSVPKGRPATRLDRLPAQLAADPGAELLADAKILTRAAEEKRLTDHATKYPGLARPAAPAAPEVTTKGAAEVPVKGDVVAVATPGFIEVVRDDKTYDDGDPGVYVPRIVHLVLVTLAALAGIAAVIGVAAIFADSAWGAPLALYSTIALGLAGAGAVSVGTEERLSSREVARDSALFLVVAVLAFALVALGGTR